MHGTVHDGPSARGCNHMQSGMNCMMKIGGSAVHELLVMGSLDEAFTIGCLGADLEFPCG